MGIGILCFLRPENLRNRVDEIKSYLPQTLITVLIDRYEGENSELRKLNDAVHAEAMALVQSGMVSRVISPKHNLGVKKAFHTLGKEVLLENDFFLYIEDDLKIKKNPKRFLELCIEEFKLKSNVVMASLYDNVQHIRMAKSDETIRLTRFPKLWGALITKEFLQRCSATLQFEEEAIEEVVSEFNLPSIEFEQDIKSIWKMKMERSIISETAWDTHLQYVLWKLDQFSIAPDQNYVLDLGVDSTSVSRQKKRNRLKLHRPDWLESSEGTLCKKCEVFGVTRYLSRRKKYLLFVLGIKGIKFL